MRDSVDIRRFKGTSTFPTTLDLTTAEGVWFRSSFDSFFAPISGDLYDRVSGGCPLASDDCQPGPGDDLDHSGRKEWAPMDR